MLNTAPALAHWPNNWSVHRLSVPMPIPKDVGTWLLEHKLFAEGNDFTSEWAQGDPDYQGNSLLRRFWRGEKNRVNLQATGMDLWVLAKDGIPQGVVSWMRTNEEGQPFPVVPTPENRSHPNHKPRQQIPAASLGVIMLYLKKDHRGQGLMRRAVTQFVAPELLACARQCRSEGGFPFVAAADATAVILEGATHVPIVDELTHSRSRVDSIWDFWNRAAMWPEIRTDHYEFLMPPTPVPVKPRKKNRVDELIAPRQTKAFSP